MKILSTKKLSEIVKLKREERNLTQEELSNITNINRLMIGRIEREDFIPSIVQLESLADTLEFEITDMFIEKEETNSFIALRSQTLNKYEKQGVDKLFTMMLSLRQQILLRSRYEDE